jgi:hypothetical protein
MCFLILKSSKFTNVLKKITNFLIKILKNKQSRLIDKDA